MSTPSVVLALSSRARFERPGPCRGCASSRGAQGGLSGRPTTRDPSVSGASFAPAHAPRQTACFASSTERVNIAEKFLSGGGLRKLVLSDEEQKQLLGAVAKHLRVLQEIPDFLPHLHVDADAVEVRASEVCDGRGVFATRAIPAHTLVTLYPATNEVSLRANRARGVTHSWRADDYEKPEPSYAMCNGNAYFGDNALRIEASSADSKIQAGFLGHLVNDAAMPPRDARDIAYAQAYLVTTTNETNCHAVPFPSGAVAVAASRDLEKDEELLMSYTFGFDAEFMRGMNADPELRKQMLTNAFAADMKVASVKMEQLTAESLKRHAAAEILSRELLVDAAEEA